MPTYVAFLRAVNVGGNTVKNDRLKALFEEAGLERVSTFIASGNVIFDSALGEEALRAALEPHLAKALGWKVDTFLRTDQELLALAPPFTHQEVEGAHSLHVGFLQEPASPEAVAAIEAVSTPGNVFRLRGREVHLLTRTGLGSWDIDEKALGRALVVPTTMRNLNTVNRILALLQKRG